MFKEYLIVLGSTNNVKTGDCVNFPRNVQIFVMSLVSVQLTDSVCPRSSLSEYLGQKSMELVVDLDLGDNSSFSTQDSNSITE